MFDAVRVNNVDVLLKVQQNQTTGKQEMKPLTLLEFLQTFGIHPTNGTNILSVSVGSVQQTEFEEPFNQTLLFAKTVDGGKPQNDWG